MHFIFFCLLVSAQGEPRLTLLSAHGEPSPALSSAHTEPPLARVRGLYQQCMISRDSCIALLSLLSEYDEGNGPLLAGYRAAGTMVMAKYAVGPWAKWKCFCQGRDLLERCVAGGRKDIELIFIRYCIQSNCPWFLNYRQSLAQDRKFIEANLDRVGDPVLKRTIGNYMRSVRR
jgi:hypothetical protein